MAPAECDVSQVCPKGRLRRDASSSLTATRRLTVGTPTRTAAQLTGVSRAAVGTKPRRPLPGAPPSPANRLSAAERAQVITALDSPRFVDQPPLQVYAQLVEEGTYLRLVSTMYRVLAENRQVRERRRLARHPARARHDRRSTLGTSSATRPATWRRSPAYCAGEYSRSAARP